MTAFIGPVTVAHTPTGADLTVTMDGQFLIVPLDRPQLARLTTHLFAAAFFDELPDDPRLQAAYNALCQVADHSVCESCFDQDPECPECTEPLR